MSTVDVVLRDILPIPMRGHAVDETDDLTLPLRLDGLVLTFYFRTNSRAEGARCSIVLCLIPLDQKKHGVGFRRCWGLEVSSIVLFLVSNGSDQNATKCVAS